MDIPHTEASTTNVGDKRVRIDDLDEVGSTLNNKINRGGGHSSHRGHHTNVGDKRVRIDDLDEVGSTLNNKNNMKWTFLTPRPPLQMSGTRGSESMIYMM